MWKSGWIIPPIGEHKACSKPPTRRCLTGLVSISASSKQNKLLVIYPIIHPMHETWCILHPLISALEMLTPMGPLWILGGSLNPSRQSRPSTGSWLVVGTTPRWIDQKRLRILQPKPWKKWILNQWPFQEPKSEVPTIYKAYIRPMQGNITTKYGLIWYSTSILGSWNSHWLKFEIFQPVSHVKYHLWHEYLVAKCH